ncbi:MAG TPA: EF-hand domain-containing protein [Candidatus Polarisedimenticolia bacterium]|nr:EF-hand domain-containing protein [Candidatus Polarisedimenticolia bacterium]
MKKILVAVMGLLCATAIVAHAQDATTTTKPARKKLTAEQKELNKEMLAKYDTDKNGKLDKNERAAITPEDKDKMIKAGLLKSHVTKKSSAGAASTKVPAQ